MQCQRLSQSGHSRHLAHLATFALAHAGGVVTVMINNPKAMNTFSKGVLAGVMQALEMCSDDPSGEWLPRGQRFELPW